VSDPVLASQVLAQGAELVGPAFDEQGDGRAELLDVFGVVGLVQGCQLSGATLLRFRHNDLDDAAAAYDTIPRESLARGAGVYLVADSVFSMDGDLFDLPAAHRFCRERGVFMILDEAHGIACVGPTGRGIEEHFDMPSTVDLLLGNFSKGIPSTGGYATGDRRVIEFLRCGYAAPHTFSSPLSPYHCGAACKALEILEREPEHVERLHRMSSRLRRELRRRGFDTGLSETPIVPLIVGSERDTLAVWRYLLDRGYFTGAVVAPAVGLGRARLRLIANAKHDPADVDAFVDCVSEAMDRVRGASAAPSFTGGRQEQT